MQPVELILQQFVDRTLSEQLLNVSVLQEGKCIASGDGSLFMKSDGKLHIEVSAKSIPVKTDWLAPVGRLIPEEEFLEIQATTPDGFRVTAERLRGAISCRRHGPSRFSCAPTNVSLFLPLVETNAKIT